jgi:hypothetical protein
MPSGKNVVREVGLLPLKSWCQKVKENSLAELRSIMKEAFQECFQNWKKH